MYVIITIFSCSLTDVHISVATPGNHANPALGVEDCSCPKQYTGQSCEACWVVFSVLEFDFWIKDNACPHKSTHKGIFRISVGNLFFRAMLKVWFWHRKVTLPKFEPCKASFVQWKVLHCQLSCKICWQKINRVKSQVCNKVAWKKKKTVEGRMKRRKERTW